MGFTSHALGLPSELHLLQLLGCTELLPAATPYVNLELSLCWSFWIKASIPVYKKSTIVGPSSQYPAELQE